MPGTRSSRTRAYLARVFAVLALVAGVAMMQGTPCETEFAWTAQCPTSSTSAIAYVADQVEDGSALLDGILVAGCCLVLALAVLIGFAVLRRTGSVPARLVPLPVWSRPSHRLEVRLAQLCVLRA
ncbi:hypothetical protein SK803_09185 [Lentzea sp. BCCO 10_0856]|uniref:MYXO-CTERM domain-containing protein n=1 Tax=Lentzea miocenica TaxID=3095431 RepID=A0ABU4SWW2_9PSEU|nr:hypothetical protein [Lentzea sp. BCCO 10_0856]MDX8030382.1 hypothetical protein [Lentzea sp. BCCO 10_0856]